MNEDYIEKGRVLNLTNEVYRLTLLFPKKEPLRDKMRALSDEVLASFVSLPNEKNKTSRLKLIKDSVKKIEILQSFCQVAANQNWVKPEELLQLEQKYNKMKEDFLELKFVSGEPKKETKKKVKRINKKESPKVEEKEKEKEGEPKGMITISPRQKKILDFLKKNERAQVWQIKEIFSDVSKRTLRRDFKSLLKEGLVKRKGERNNTYYVLG